MEQQIKKLDAAGLKALRDLEEELGCCILALERQPAPAKLSADELKELQKAEKEMDSILVAYKC